MRPDEKMLPEMTLRDWFAGAAMRGMLASGDCFVGKAHASLAADAYCYADAMLAARREG